MKWQFHSSQRIVIIKVIKFTMWKHETIAQNENNENNIANNLVPFGPCFFREIPIILVFSPKHSWVLDSCCQEVLANIQVTTALEKKNREAVCSHTHTQNLSLY